MGAAEKARRTKGLSYRGMAVSAMSFRFMGETPMPRRKSHEVDSVRSRYPLAAELLSAGAEPTNLRAALRHQQLARENARQGRREGRGVFRPAAHRRGLSR